MPVKKLQGDVLLANESFRVKSYLRSTTDGLISRFGSAEQGQSNLDLLRAETQKSFKGGMFQRNFEDPERVSSITGAYFNKIDDRLYFTPQWSQVANQLSDMNINGVFSWAWYRNEIYISFQFDNGTNGFQKINPFTGAITPLNSILPSSLGTTPRCFRLTAFGDYLFFAPGQGVGTTEHDFRWDGTTFQDLGATLSEFIEFSGNLCGVNPAGGFYTVTNYTAAGSATYNLVSLMGSRPATGNLYYQSYAEYNNALYIGMQHGLYRYDGVNPPKLILDYRKNPSNENFKFMAVFNGRLYFTVRNQIHEFDGTNISILQDFGEAYIIKDMAGSSDRLWIATLNDNLVSYSDKFGTGSYQYTHSVFCYNGIGFFEYYHFNSELEFDSVGIRLAPVNNHVFCIVPDIADVAGSPDSSGYFNYLVNLDYEFSLNNLGTDREFVVTSSVMDLDYPSVAKSLNGIMATYDGFSDDNNAHLSVQLSYFHNGVWTAFDEVWNTQNVGVGGVTADYLLHEQVRLNSPNLDTTPGVFHKFRFRIIATISGVVSSPPSLADFTVRYTIQPNARLRWLLTLEIQGEDSKGLTTPRLSDRSKEVRTANMLRKIIYDAYRNKLPILFYDADFTEIQSLVPLRVHGTEFVSAGDVLAFQDAAGDADPWINQQVLSVVHDDLNDRTELVLADAGYREGIGGSANAALALGAQVRKSYAVYVKRITNERYILNENTINNSGRNYSDIPSELVVELEQV